MSTESTLKIYCPQCEQKLDLSGFPAFAMVQCPSCHGEIMVPRQFGSFLLEEIVGEGGMATVYRSLDLTLNREVAIKLLNEDLALEEEELARHFLNEARAAASVSHPNVVPIYTCGEHEGKIYMVMQFMERQSLDLQVSRGEDYIPLSNAMAWGMHAASGLAAAYDSGIVHHDVKPANILLDSDNVAKVGDFGLAQVLRDDEHSESLLGWATPYYMSPEKAMTGEEDYRGDIYSLGATFYHVITGRPPFEGRNPQEIMNARLGHTPRPPSALRPDVPAEVDSFLLTLLQSKPEHRPQTYADVVEGFSSLAHTLRARENAPQVVVLSSPTAAQVRNRHPRIVVRANRKAQGSVANVRKVMGQRRKAKTGDAILLTVLGLVAFVLILAKFGLFGGGGNAEQGAPNDGSGVQETATGTGSPDTPGTGTFRNRRPRPPGADFAGVRRKLEQYLASVPADQQQAERERIERIRELRTRLVGLMNVIAYDNAAHGVILRNGTIMKGRVIGATDSHLRMDGLDHGAAQQDVPWRETALEQYEAFVEFYVRKRTGQSWASASPQVNNAPEAARDCLDLAVLFDWYGVPDKATQYHRKAVAYDPSIHEEAARLLEPTPRIHP